MRALVDHGPGSKAWEGRAEHFDVDHCTFQLEHTSHRDHERATHP
jgi:hypothetical protein